MPDGADEGSAGNVSFASAPARRAATDGWQAVAGGYPGWKEVQYPGSSCCLMHPQQDAVHRDNRTLT